MIAQIGCLLKNSFKGEMLCGIIKSNCVPHTFATLLPCNQRSTLRYGDSSEKVFPIVTSGKRVLVSAKEFAGHVER
jgi:hypothetical protein